MPSPACSCGQTRRHWRISLRPFGHAPLFGLASAGVYQARELPLCWWALTPPFQFCLSSAPGGHDCPEASPNSRRQAKGCPLTRPRSGIFFSVALSPGHPELSFTAGLILKSPDFPPALYRSQRRFTCSPLKASLHYTRKPMNFHSGTGALSFLPIFDRHGGVENKTNLLKEREEFP